MIVKSQDRQIFDRLTFVGRSGACIRPIPAEKHGRPRPALLTFQATSTYTFERARNLLHPRY